jgi:hypothetical protein
MRVISLLLAASVGMFAAGEPAIAQDSSNNARDRLPKTEQKTQGESASAPTEPITPEKSIPAGGELDQGTRARTRDDVIRDTLRDRRSR